MFIPGELRPDALLTTFSRQDRASGSDVISRMRFKAASIDSRLEAATFTVPSSSMSILAPDFCDDLADHRAARADHFADLVGRDLDRLDARSVLTELGAGSAQRLRHLAEDVQAAIARLIERDCA